MGKKSPYNCCNNKNLKIVQGETSFESVDKPLSLTFISQSNRFRNDRVFITSDKPLLIRVTPESFKRGMLTLI